MSLPALRAIANPRPLVIGHRGYCRFAPENTLPSFELALASGADLVELDCRPSKDGQFMVIHDAELDRTTDATRRWGGKRIRVQSKTAAEIQSLDAGRWFGAHFAGTRVPLLATALDAIQRTGVTLIERKSGEAAALVKLLREKDLINKVVVQSFDWAFLREFHRQEPAQVLAGLGPPSRLPTGRKAPALLRGLNAGWLRHLGTTGARVVVWNKQVPKRAVHLAHHRGFKVWVYTVDELRLANRLLDRGVDGIITNNTGLIWKVMALRHAGGMTNIQS
jgi:glycerophosphoryl diester phosphodiesterase